MFRCKPARSKPVAGKADARKEGAPPGRREEAGPPPCEPEPVYEEILEPKGAVR